MAGGGRAKGEGWTGLGRAAIDAVGAMLGIPYRVYQLQRLRQSRQSHQGPAPTAALMDGIGAPGGVLLHPIFPTYAWGFSSKVMASFAALVLMSGLILTLHTLKATISFTNYRPAILTILGIIFIIIGPVVACKIVLAAYDRRLARQHHHAALALRRERAGMRREARESSIFLRPFQLLLGSPHTGPTRGSSFKPFHFSACILRGALDEGRPLGRGSRRRCRATPPPSTSPRSRGSTG